MQQRLPVQDQARPWHQVQKCPVGQKSPGVSNAGHAPKYPLWGPACFTGSICAPCWDLAGEAGGCVALASLSCFWLLSSAAGSTGSCALAKNNSWGSCRPGAHPAQSSPLLFARTRCVAVTVGLWAPSSVGMLGSSCTGCKKLVHVGCAEKDHRSGAASPSPCSVSPSLRLRWLGLLEKLLVQGHGWRNSP